MVILTVILTVTSFLAVTLGQSRCPEGYDDKVHEGSCYYFSGEDKRNFDEAKLECESLDASLVTIETDAEFDHVQKTLSSETGSHWANAERVTPGFYWATGDHIPTKHYGWAPDQPGSSGGQDDCIKLNHDKTFRMSNAKCEEKLSFVCESYAADCPNGFLKAKDESGCFYISEGDATTWHDARASCQAIDAELASFVKIRFHFRFIRAELRKLKSGTSYWVSGRRAEFTWGTGETLPSSFKGWKSGEPDNLNDEQNCVEFDVQSNFQLNDWACIETKSFVCERQAACPEGFIHSTEHRACYHVSNKGTAVTGTEAQTACEAIGADLVSYETEDELDFVTKYLKSIGGIGDYYTSGKRKDLGFHWSNGELLETSFAGWAKDQPNFWNGDQYCMEMRNDKYHYFNDLKCSEELAFVCEMSMDSTNNCVRNADFKSCYYFHKTPLANFYEARDLCQFMNGDLVSLETIEEFNWVKSNFPSQTPVQAKTWNKGTSYWTSVTRAEFAWATGAPLSTSHRKWGATQPNNWKGNQDCVEVMAKTDNMNDALCDKPNEYVCEIRAQ